MSEYPQLLNLIDDDRVHINSNKFSVGRSLSNDYILNSAFASRVQFTLENKDGAWTIQDKSTNGTHVNHTNIKNGEVLTIGHGDVLRFQDIALRFIASAAELPVVEEVFPLEELIPLDDYPPPEDIENSPAREPEEVPEIGQKRAHGNSPDDDEDQSSPKKSKQNDCIIDSSMDEDLRCSICSELFVKAVTLCCCHTFCKYCINYWRAKRPFCPICRKHIGPMAPTLVLDNFIAKLVDRMGEAAKQERMELIRQRSEEGSSSSARSQGRNNLLIPIASIVLSSDDESGDDDMSDEEINFEEVPYSGGRDCFRCDVRGHWANHCPFQ